MDQEDEVDIEGDFELKAGDLLGSFCDINELPSKSVNLQPEFSEHPWLLEQGWSLDHCADEKSKAAIGKMLLEEQSYIEGKPPDPPKPPSSSSQHHVQTGHMIPGCPSEHKHTNNKVATAVAAASTRGKHWDEEEKAIFFKGLEVYGRKWSRIAELIPTRTAEQVKHFGQHYYKMKNKPVKKRMLRPAATSTAIPPPLPPSLPVPLRNVIPTHAPTLEAMLKTVTTAQPTITMLSKVSLGNQTALKLPPNTGLVIKPIAVPQAPPPPPPPPLIAMGGVSKKKQSESQPAQPKSPRRPPAKKQVKRSRSCENPIKSEVSEEIVRIVKSETHSEDEDIVIDIDSDREDYCYTKRTNLINALHLNGTDPAPLSPFKPQFTSSSSCKLSSSPEITALGLSGDSVLIKEEVFPLSPLPNIPEMDQKLDNGQPTIPSSDDSGFLPSSLGASDFSPNELFNDEIGTMSAEAKVELLTPTTTGSICRSSSSPDLHYLLGGPSGLKYGDNFLNADSRGSETGSFDFIPKVRCNSEVGYARYTASEGGGGGHEEAGWRPDDYDNADASSGESETEEHPNEYGVVTSDGEVVYLPNPTKEKFLAKDEILDDEKTIHSEFFDGRRGLKNEERYLRIRNFILDSWEKSKPHYLNKTSVRPGLKNCGDVNCIGRIHCYLEQIGAINYGCPQAQYNKRCGGRGGSCVKLNKDRTPKEVLDTLAAARSECMRPRKRKVRELFTFSHWNDQELGGRTIEHKSDGEEVEEEVRRPPRIRPKALRARHSHTHQYDPFKLVPCQAFTHDNQAPFTVVIESAALVVMDAHAHLSKTEVIGLLGGRFLREHGHLHITRAEPCESLSTGMQCEMDPVSQMQASEKILSKEATVVGWYHSHPTFDPNPSVRDIQTQEGFQTWFAEGGNPFVGIIVSPYNRIDLSLCAKTKCILIQKPPESSASSSNSTAAATQPLGIPHEFEFSISDDMWKRSKVGRKVAKLIHKYATYANRVELLHHFKSINNITCLQKLLRSVEQYPDPDVCDIQQLRDDITTKVSYVYTSQCETQYAIQ